MALSDLDCCFRIRSVIGSAPLKGTDFVIANLQIDGSAQSCRLTFHKAFGKRRMKK
jgi:hypothetical protein